MYVENNKNQTNAKFYKLQMSRWILNWYYQYRGLDCSFFTWMTFYVTSKLFFKLDHINLLLKCNLFKQYSLELIDPHFKMFIK